VFSVLRCMSAFMPPCRTGRHTLATLWPGMPVVRVATPWPPPVFQQNTQSLDLLITASVRCCWQLQNRLMLFGMYCCRAVPRTHYMLACPVNLRVALACRYHQHIAFDMV
jgi:hypothetical protein